MATADCREYSPVQGNWLRPDPAGLAAVDAENPQSWNRYAYVLNDPTGLVDPSGLAGEPPLPPPPGVPGLPSLICINPLGCSDIPEMPTQNIPRLTVAQFDDTRSRGKSKTPAPAPKTAMSGPPKSCSDQLADMLNDINSVRGNSASGIKGLSQRFAQILKGSHADPGHLEQFQNKQVNLQTKIDDYRNSGCGEPPPQVTAWANMPAASPWAPPSRQNFSSPKWLGPASVVTGAAACAILVPGCFEVEGGISLVP